MPMLLIFLFLITIVLFHAALIEYRYWKRRKECEQIAKAHGVLEKFNQYMEIEDPYGQLTPDVALDMALDRRWNSEQLIDLGDSHD